MLCDCSLMGNVITSNLAGGRPVGYLTEDLT